jgi:hypothetical protein
MQIDGRQEFPISKRQNVVARVLAPQEGIGTGVYRGDLFSGARTFLRLEREI